MGKYFGTDGFRGEANVKLTVEHAFKVGRYLGWYYGREHKARIVIGKDTRRSSYMFEYALAAGITASGADAYLLHVTTTPSVSYVVRTEGFDCGIMISASHNPFYDNGIKVINGLGHKLEAEVEEKIEAYIDGRTEERPLATGADIGRTVDFSAGRNRYIGYLISLPTRSFKNMRVGLDRQERVRRPGREDLCDQQRAGRHEYQYELRLHPYRGAAEICEGEAAGCGLRLRRRRGPLHRRG